MPNPLQNLHTVDETSFAYVFEQNVDVPLQAAEGTVVRVNVYRPKGSGPDQRVPVLCTYGPYGKDTWYGDFHAKSYAELNPEHQGAHAAWETPAPAFWTRHGYAVVRADERGIGQSPGLLDTMSRGTSEAFFDVVEWAAAQPWSSGKVGLLGISYYAGSQWRVAARRPRGLSAIVPWEGMADYYRDRVRHGGILSNRFIQFWYNRQVVSNQYGRPADEPLEMIQEPGGGGPKRPASAPETLEGRLPADERAANRRDQPVDTRAARFRDEAYFASKEYDLGDIAVPLLSVGNWGGILLHLRGNLEGYRYAGSPQKWLRMIVGRHDLPFYYAEEVAVQRSFLDCFLKGEDRDGWTTGRVPPVSLVLRKGDVGFNRPAAEQQFARRAEQEWPLARTQYTPYYLTPADRGLTPDRAAAAAASVPRTKVTYQALGTLEAPQAVQFATAPFAAETEITGHVVAHLNVSLSALPRKPTPSEIDLFVTLRHIAPAGQEVFYTGTAGDPVPLTKGWLRVSLRKTNPDHPRHRPYLPWRDYVSTDAQPVIVGETYAVDVEVWATNVVVEAGGRIVLEVASGDTQGTGIFQHNDPVDRAPEKLQGLNHIVFSQDQLNYVTLPIIPPKE